jgi:hypothetical protein
MQVTQAVIPAGDAVSVAYVFLTDVHLGIQNCDEERFSAMVERIAGDSTCWWIGGGDFIEAINYTDKRFDPRCIAPRFREHLDDLATYQIEEFGRLVEPIRDRCLGVHSGNHEETIRLRYHIHVMRDLCKLLGLDFKTQFLDATALVRLRIERNGKSPLQYTIYSEHGSGGGAYAGPKLNRLQMVPRSFEADIYQKGHVHDKIAMVQPRLAMRMDGRPHLIERPQLFMIGGCFYRTYQEGITSYGEKRGYLPTELGNLKITFSCETGKFTVSEA